MAMMNAEQMTDEARYQLQRVAGGWVVPLARAGYIAKGAVYAVIGILAIQTAVGAGGGTVGSKGAIAEIASQPFGQVLLALLTVGLFGYVVWRFAQSVLNAESHDNDAKGIGKRLFYGFSGVLHAALAVFAGRLALGLGGGGSSGTSKQALTADLMAVPVGQWIVALLGGVIIVTGAVQLYFAYTAHFMGKYRVGQMDTAEYNVALRAGQAGLSARGVVFAIMGGFFVNAAISQDPSEAKGLDAALATLADQAFGPWLLAAVSVGLLGYAVHCGFKAWYRHFETP